MHPVLCCMNEDLSSQRESTAYSFAGAEERAAHSLEVRRLCERNQAKHPGWRGQHKQARAS